MTRILLVGIGAALALSAGCKEEAPKKIPFPAEKPPAQSPVPAPANPAQPPNESTPPSAGRTDAEVKPAASPGKSTVTFKGFAIDVPTDWTTQPVSNPAMRAAQFEWPKATSDAEAPTLVVYFFGKGGGGTVEANLDRWRSLFVEGGTPAPGVTQTFNAGSTTITLLDKSGTFKQQATPMSQEFTPTPDWQMLAAVAEIEGGPLFFRATGPQASVAAQKDAFMKSLRTLRSTGPGDFPQP